MAVAVVVVVGGQHCVCAGRRGRSGAGKEKGGAGEGRKRESWYHDAVHTSVSVLGEFLHYKKHIEGKRHQKDAIKEHEITDNKRKEERFVSQRLW